MRSISGGTLAAAITAHDNATAQFDNAWADRHFADRRSFKGDDEDVSKLKALVYVAN